ncbi:MAG: hypothetical protein GQ582_04790 [Methyloprofundus sp.]|nr:hypothetical protein [Methyloprofundus sp.]
MKKISLLLLFLTYSQCIFADNLNDSNQLFNWAEENFPQYFSPAKENTFEIESYLVRYYKKAELYIGTLEQEVYVYGEVFNGLQHVGSIEDFIALSHDEIKVIEQIKLVGSSEFISNTEASLELLKTSAPVVFAKIQDSIATIEQAEYSHMWAGEEPPRYAVADTDSFYSTQWYAGAIAHEAKHSELYQAYLAEHGLPVPDSIWRSDAAEQLCVDYQIEVLKKINAPQFDIDYLKQLGDLGADF